MQEAAEVQVHLIYSYVPFLTVMCSATVSVLHYCYGVGY